MIRLDKYLADMGAGTRSEVKLYIRKGMVTVSDQVIRKPETKIDIETQTVSLNGKVIHYQAFEYFMLNKPSGVVSAVRDDRDKTVIDLITEKSRKDLFPVGRLDKDTEGLLLITNDGELAHRLLAPGKHVNKVYYAKVEGLVTSSDVAQFKTGVHIGDEKPTMPAELEIISAGAVSEIHLTIQEGRFHQVKRMFEAVNKKVVYLKRLSMGTLILDETLAPGTYRRLTKEELKALC